MVKHHKKIKSQDKKPKVIGYSAVKSDFFTVRQHENTYLLIALGLTFIIYIPSLFNDFVLNWDDGGYIVVNEVVHKLSWENIKIMFSTFDKGNYHPLTTFFYAFEYALAGENAMLYHINNLIIHLINVLLVFRLVMRFNKNTFIAFTTAVLFGIHPMHVESVAWISERKDVMFTMFFLLSLLSYHSYSQLKGGKNKFLLALLFFFLSLMSKSAAVPLPVVLLLIDFILKRKLSSKLIIEKLPFFVLSFLFGILAILSQNKAGAIQDLTPLFTVGERLMLASYALLAYIAKLFVPINLCAMYPYPDRIGGELPVLFKVAPFVVLALFGLVAWSLKYSRHIAFGFAFFVVMIALVLQLLPVGGALMAERYTYVPYIGLFYILGYGIVYLKKHNRLLYQISATLLAAGIVASAYLTYERIKVWENGEVLFTDVINKNPNLPFAYNNRGYLYYRFHEDYEKAYADYSKCLAIDPNFDKAYSNRGVLLFNMNRFEEALPDFDKALSFKPDNLDALRGRANTYSSLKLYAEGIPDYNTYLKIKPEDESMLLWRGTAYYQTGKSDSALSDFNHTLRINPVNDEAFYWRGLVFYSQQDYDKAIQDFSTSLRLNDKRHEVYSWRGLAYYYSKKIELAIADYDKAIVLNPNDAAALVNRSIAYHEMGNHVKAFEDIKAAGDLGHPLDRTYFFKLYNLVEGR